MKYACSPAWSFPGRKPGKPSEGTPGPGQYPSQSSLSGGGVRLGKEARDHDGRKEVPGPGAYDPRVKAVPSAPR
jgi:hypothetical protein